MKTTVLIAAAAALVLVACGAKDVSFDTLETARSQGKANAEFNAKMWRAQLKNYAEDSILSRGDSSQTPTCPQGDGWATLDLIAPAGNRRLTLKCSTVSSNVGCRESSDFKQSPFANEDGQCQPTTKVPHPLPNIAK